MRILSVCLSVRPSISLSVKRVICDKMVANFVGPLPVLAACHISSFCLLNVELHWRIKIDCLICVGVIMLSVADADRLRTEQVTGFLMIISLFGFYRAAWNADTV